MTASAVSLNFVIILKRYRKQGDHFEFFGNMADTRDMFKPNLLLFRIWRYCHFEFETIWLLARQV
jgi:hypothetical protein